MELFHSSEVECQSLFKVLAATCPDIDMIRSYHVPGDERALTFILYVFPANKMRAV